MNEGHVGHWNVWNVNATWSESLQRSATGGLPQNQPQSQHAYSTDLLFTWRHEIIQAFPIVLSEVGDNGPSYF